ncbi:hypothetical protein H8B02_30515 [Bradyrhizobium sp. Pear77]|uniref:hypothetical protein n=1 Tax=Bradyrhizobium TaxID=374 RepID=UPI001E443349|nr:MULTISPECIES: hypothetical protein [Bradyrhizobium]MCC8957610.1 hypothetical protein [Bradyrhizobium altum]MCC8968584.1 hypothetical protein [Bradyrhizobium oropedii]
MGLFSIKGTITAYGQHDILKDGCIYQWIEMQDEHGQRINVSKVFATNAILSLLVNLNIGGEFYFETIRGKKRLFGVKSMDGAVAFDEMNARARVGGLLFLQGVPLLLIFGLGAIPMAMGLFYLFTPNDSARREIFYGSDRDEAIRLRQQVPIRI